MSNFRFKVIEDCFIGCYRTPDNRHNVVVKNEPYAKADLPSALEPMDYKYGENDEIILLGDHAMYAAEAEEKIDRSNPLFEKTVKELKSLAKGYGLKGYSKYNEAELVEAIQSAIDAGVELVEPKPAEPKPETASQIGLTTDPESESDGIETDSNSDDGSDDNSDPESGYETDPGDDVL